MYRLEKEFTFDAAHCLEAHKGKCKRLHGHRWKAWVICEGEKLNEEGMLIDFGDLKGIIRPMVEQYLDHQFLNDTLGLEHTTAESISWWIYSHLAPKISTLVGVVVEESPGSRCAYFPPGIQSR